MCTLNQAAAPASTVQALAMVSAGLGFLAGCDAADLGTAAQAEALVGLERAEAQHTAARARILAAFRSRDGYQADGHYGAGSWLRAVTKVTPGAAGGALGWARRLAAHPVIAAALAGGQLSASWARQICDWTGQLPEDLRADADRILLAAARGGADLHDLNALAAEMIERARATPDTDDGGFADRAVWLQTTLGGAGRLQGDLTPECAASVPVILDALSQRGGPEDTRTAAQRRHDALQQACEQLISAGLDPGPDGPQPALAQVQIHIDLAALRGLPGAAGLEAGWSLARAAATDPGSVYLSGAAAEAATCDAVLTPIVSGQPDWTVLDQLTDLFLHARGHGQEPQQNDGQPDADRGDRPDAGPGGPPANGTGGRNRTRPPVRPAGTARPDLPRHPPAAPRHPADHEHQPFVRARRPGVLPARHHPGRALHQPQPAPRCRPQHPHRPTPPPQSRHPPGPALPVPRLRPATVPVRRPPPNPLVPRRPHLAGEPEAPVQIPPPDRDSPLGLDTGLPPRWDHHRHQPRRTRPALPRTTRKDGVTPRVGYDRAASATHRSWPGGW